LKAGKERVPSGVKGIDGHTLPERVNKTGRQNTNVNSEVAGEWLEAPPLGTVRTHLSPQPWKTAAFTPREG